MVNAVYRSMNKDDCKAVLKFWAESPGVHLQKNGEDTADGISAFLERNPGFSFIAELDGNIIGAVLCGHDGRRGCIYHLAVDTTYRRSGIGRKLLRLSVEQLKASNIKKGFLCVLKENDIGEAFYKSLYWKEENGVKLFAKVI